MRPLERDLGVLLAVGDEERHPDALDHTVQMHLLGDAHEVVDVLGTPHPADVLPVVRHGEVALFFQALLLHVAPVVIRAPGHATDEAWLEGDRARAVVAAEGNAFQTDAFGIDIGARLQPVDDPACPMLGIEARGHAMQAQGLAGARLIHYQRGNTALGEHGRQADQVFHFLERIEAVELHQNGRRPANPFSRHEEPGEVFSFVGDLDTFALVTRQEDAPVENIEGTLVKLQTPWGTVGLQTLASDQVASGTLVFFAC